MAILLASVPTEGAETQVELYRTAHRQPSELLPIAHDLLAPAGGASADPRTGTLVLRGEPEALAEALEVLRRLDVALAEFRVRAVVTSQAELTGLGISFEGTAGPVVIERDGPAQLTLAGLFDASRSRVRTELRVREGSWGSLWTGREIPIDVHVIRGGRRDRRRVLTHVAPGGRSGMRVRARSHDDGSVELDVEPVVERFEGEALTVTGARLRVRLRPGEVAAVADTTTQNEGQQEWLLGTDARSARDASAVLLYVERVED